MSVMRWGYGALLPLAVVVVISGIAVIAVGLSIESDPVAAVGSLEGSSPALSRAFSNDGEFEEKREPSPGDWLDSHRERGQTFDAFVSAPRAEPMVGKQRLYILPIGEFEEGMAPDLGALEEHASAFFHPLPVESLPRVAAEDVPAASRLNPHTGRMQWRTPDILEWMLGRAPEDSYAMLAVTMTDLYPDDDWNYVFGHATYTEGVGISSFARYHPSWSRQEAEGCAHETVLRRSAKVVAHELGHMFGMAHCIHYECLMNGVNHIGELDAAPMHLCPVCLRKLHHALGFDPLERYELLESSYARHGLRAEKEWVRARIEAIELHR